MRKARESGVPTVAGDPMWGQLRRHLRVLLRLLTVRDRGGLPRRTGAAGALGGVDDGGVRRRLRMWRVVATLVAFVGWMAGIWSAAAVAHGDAARAERAFASSSDQVVGSLSLAIQHEDDLIVSTGAAVVSNPGMSNAAFAGWVDSVRAMRRYPELDGIGLVAVVRNADLPAFAARAERDPAGPLGPRGRFQLLPAGHRSFYCLPVLSALRPPLTLPAAYDQCAPAKYKASIRANIDSGRSAYSAAHVFGATYLVVEMPLYRAGSTPQTVAERRKEFVGLIATMLRPETVLKQALVGHPGVAVAMRYRAFGSKATFASGTVPADAWHRVVDLHNGWMIRTFAAPVSGSIVANRAAVFVLVADVAVGALLALLIYILATGRARALLLVQRKTDELRHQALHDALTGLPNRALIVDRAEQLLARGRRSGVPGAALFIDLDDFKTVNDTLGHGAGDQLLQAMAQRLTATLRDADTIGRMGGDEFVVLIDGAGLQSAPELVAERIIDVMRQPFTLDEAPAAIQAGASVGIAMGDRANPAELLRHADVALYEAKAAGKNCYRVFDTAMGSDVQRRYELEFDLRAALETRQFRLVYQPIYNLDDLSMSGMEALLRWQHPIRGTVLPAEFVPMLESSGLITEVGRWVLRTACAQMAGWHAAGCELSVSVNVSGRQLDDGRVVDHVREALASSGLNPAALTLEITETALMRDVETSAAHLRELKALGVQIAIDDFGTGYSSLAYLEHLPVDCLKIDRAFTQAITRSPESDALIHTLVQLGKDLGLRTLAEGVERNTQLAHLRSERVDEIQGFLLAEPLDPSSLDRHLIRTSATPTLPRALPADPHAVHRHGEVAATTSDS
ncbi:MAG TPA: EAL domain-containing protein [Mycobacterium sp.]|jgi:diguanylate cyclase (GGDEF)-like protein|nr:EAL domain-containing protein [Mycobacterium sp.]